MLKRLINHVFVDLVTDQHNLSRRQNFLQLQHVLVPPDHATWVMRGIDQNSASFGRDSSLNFVEIGFECAWR